jgi:hypothetical protein
MYNRKYELRKTSGRDVAITDQTVRMLFTDDVGSLSRDLRQKYTLCIGAGCIWRK